SHIEKGADLVAGSSRHASGLQVLFVDRSGLVELSTLAEKQGDVAFLNPDIVGISQFPVHLQTVFEEFHGVARVADLDFEQPEASENHGFMRAILELASQSKSGFELGPAFAEEPHLPLA